MRRVLVVLVLALAPSIASAQPPAVQGPLSDNRLAQEHYAEAWTHFRSEQWDDAVDDFQAAINADDTFAMAYYGLGRTHMAAKRFSAAIRAYERCRQLFQLHRSTDATGAIREPAALLLALGSAYLRSEQFDAAERSYKEAVQIDPRLGEAHNNLAALYLMLGRYDEAAASVKNAEKTGFPVNPALKQEIESKRKSR